MCGITGGIHHSLSPEHRARMLHHIAHRGPDDRGLFVDGATWLGSVRLSIQDLSGRGHMPMQTPDGRYTIVFNGEIYNHRELRRELESKGVAFHSGSDTETLLQAFAHFGPECLQRLEGIFAFVIYDRVADELFLARDPLGVKPLYYYEKDGCLLFASELKALMGLPDVDYSLDPSRFYYYLLLLYSPGEDLAFRYFKKLPPGHFIRVKQGTIRPPERYYRLPFNGAYDSDIPAREWVRLTEAALLQAVDAQLLSDAPVGFFLSGGLDSSLLVAMARKVLGRGGQRCFTIDTGGELSREGFSDDLPYARQVATHLGASLEVVSGHIDIVRDFDGMVRQLDEPQADPAALHVLYIAQAAAREGVKVLISGAGADDVFSGYRRHQALRWEGLARQVPGFIRKPIVQSARMAGAVTLSRRLSRLLQVSGKDALEQRIATHFWLPPHDVTALFHPDVARGLDTDAAARYYTGLLAEIPGEHHPLNQLLALELRTFLPDHNLNYTDKMSMAAGIETRVPYLDTDLVALSARMPPALKMKGTQTKYILRQVAEKYLPKEIIYRKKTGFAAPVRQWIAGPMKGMIEERLLSGSLEQWNIFSPEAVGQLVRDHRSGRKDAAYPIFALLAIESWLRQFTHWNH